VGLEAARLLAVKEEGGRRIDEKTNILHPSSFLLPP
jgi:hypothetical protein